MVLLMSRWTQVSPFESQAKTAPSSPLLPSQQPWWPSSLLRANKGCPEGGRSLSPQKADQASCRCESVIGIERTLAGTPKSSTDVPTGLGQSFSPLRPQFPPIRGNNRISLRMVRSLKQERWRKCSSDDKSPHSVLSALLCYCGGLTVRKPKVRKH